MLFVFLTIHMGLIVAAIVAAFYGLWSIALVDFAAFLVVLAGIIVCIPKKRATVSYEEIIKRQKIMSNQPLYKTNASLPDTEKPIDIPVKNDDIETLRSAA